MAGGPSAVATRPVDDHPLSCHRPRFAERVCFQGILWRLVTGCSWVTAGRIVGMSATTLRRRRDAWIAAGVFEALCAQALAAYDRIIGLDLSETAIDGSLHKAPSAARAPDPTPPTASSAGSGRWPATGGASPSAGRSPAPTATTLPCSNPPSTPSRPVGCSPTSKPCTLDRGYDTNNVRTACGERDPTDLVISKRHKPTKNKANKSKHSKNNKPAGDKRLLVLGLRWTVERTNSWSSNYGQLRRNTDRRVRYLFSAGCAPHSALGLGNAYSRPG